MEYPTEVSTNETNDNKYMCSIVPTEHAQEYLVKLPDILSTQLLNYKS